jgi:hypothetical protein
MYDVTNEGRSCNRYCGGKTVLSIACYDVIVALPDAMRKRHVVICDLTGSALFLYITS